MKNFYIAITQNGLSDASPGNISLVLGPFTTLGEAEDHFDDTKRYVSREYDLQWAHFWGYSIVGVEDYDKPGKLNHVLLAQPPVVFSDAAPLVQQSLFGGG